MIVPDPDSEFLRLSEAARVLGIGDTTLKKGSYTFLCPVPGHAAAGMKGTLTVR